VNHAIHSRQDLDESAKVSHAHHFPGVDMTNERRFSEGFNSFPSSSFILAIGCGDIYCPIIINVDFYIGLFLNRTDDLPTRSNDRADLLHWHLQSGDSGYKGAQFRARYRNDFQHLIENGQASRMCLFECLAHDFGGDPFNLDIHLQCGDTFGGSGNFKVHVAKVIFSALNIGKDHKAVAFLD